MIPLLRRTVLLGSAALALAPGLRRARAAEPAAATPPAPVDVRARLAYPYALPPLPYAYEANAPTVDAETMRLHHDKHHAAYVANLNAALKDHTELHDVALPDLLARLDTLPDGVRAAVRNNGGGHAWHTMFWQVMGGRGGAPEGELGAAVARDFGSFDALKAAFAKAGAGQFGSGWAAVTADREGKLALLARPNQDSPLMEGKSVLFGNDVWEHAYYLTYRNRRPDYLAAWWNVVDWGRVAERYAAIRGGATVV
ncbi:superoxide dismutase [Lichenibacterium dinghuense]|uniref:superoxide dismutase n=1 Tax=Lichenibacterium dinghuense TaxID=2895977 RepID=UPI001F406D79|nr:superoxide dismutase [Lichenibacterium sp. 6Y81]